MRRIIPLGFMLSVGAAFAQDWQRLDGPAVQALLPTITLRYDNGTLQSFAADGTTPYGSTTGRWRVSGDRYCSTWPPSDRWTCYDIERSGDAVRFTGPGQDIAVGQIVP